MPDQKIRFEDGASYERMMGTWSRLLEPNSYTGSRRVQACDGLMSVAATAHSRNCSSNVVRQPRFTASTRLKANLPSLAAAPLLGSPSFIKGTLWSCRSRTADSMRP